jgi:hypothetical protein
VVQPLADWAGHIAWHLHLLHEHLLGRLNQLHRLLWAYDRKCPTIGYVEELKS